jgi:hypothetical protein
VRFGERHDAVSAAFELLDAFGLKHVWNASGAASG